MPEPKRPVEVDPARVAKARKIAKLTQVECGKATGYSLPQVQRYESGETEPSVGYLRKLSNLAALSFDWFFETSETMQTETQPPPREQSSPGTEQRLLAMIEKQQELMAEQQAWMERQRQDMAEMTKVIKTQQDHYIQERLFQQKQMLRRDEELDLLRKKVEQLEKNQLRGRQQSLDPPAGPGLAGEG